MESLKRSVEEAELSFTSHPRRAKVTAAAAIKDSPFDEPFFEATMGTGPTAVLMRTMEKGDLNQLEVELSNFIDAGSLRIGEQGSSLLHVAVSLGQPELVELLLCRGGKPSVKNNLGETPLLKAVNTKSCFVYKTFKRILYLLRSTVDEKGGPLEQTPLVAAASGVAGLAGRQGACLYYCIILLAEHLQGRIKLNVDAADKSGNTALHYAAAAPNDVLVRLLVQAGARLDLRDKNGKVPMQLTPAIEARIQTPQDTNVNTTPVNGRRRFKPRRTFTTASTNGGDASEDDDRAMIDVKELAKRVARDATSLQSRLEQVTAEMDVSQRGWSLSKQLLSFVCGTSEAEITLEYVQKLLTFFQSSPNDVARISEIFKSLF